MIVLAGAILRHGGHNLRRDVAHAVENDIGCCLQRLLRSRLRFSPFLNPVLNRKPFRRGFGLKCGGLLCPLPIIDADNTLLPQLEPKGHEPQCLVAIPDQLMTGSRIAVACEITADLGDHAYHFTQQHWRLQSFFLA